ncbi:CapA family protein [Patescibacteria group bacterium]|nr:CapA family protein [Patescibacteria group bacterium]MBU2036354.1 CapA family protein [Patescibacteria group bacterium]
MKRFRTFVLLVLFFFILISFFFYQTRRNDGLQNSVSDSFSILPSISKKAEVILTGDVMIGRSVLINALDRENNPNYPFLYVSDYLSSADLVFSNLESPIVTDCPRFEHGFTFCADPRIVEGLVSSNINVVSLANNHILNFGKDGLEDTKRYLDNSNILYTGVDNLAVKEIKDTTFGFLGFDFTVNVPTQKDWDLIKESDSKVDVLIIGVHWGEEYKEKANNNQRAWARKMVENGADVISGHHPHWVEDYEYINGKPVYYSLGNFVFDQMWSEETKKSLLVKLTFEDGKIVGEEFKNTYIENIGQPKIVRE